MQRTGTRTAAGQSVLNTILQQIPEQEFSHLQPHLQFLQFKIAQCLGRAGTPITTVYCLNRGVGSLIIEAHDARSVEVGISGFEDMIGLPVMRGLEELTYSVVIQAPGDGFRVFVSVIKQLLPRMPNFGSMLFRRLAIRAVESAQNTACNRLHSVSQRLARWLLLSHDRLSSDTIDTTHDFLSKMVGTDRATVSLGVADLERKGIARRGRGSITITDRRKLEERSCECYGIFSRFNAELGLRSSCGR